MLKRENVADVYPLTPFQEGLVYRELVDRSLGGEGPHAYFQQLTFRLRGSLDVDAFAQAWQQLLARHDLLRTAFPYKFKDRPLQVVLKTCPWNLRRQVHEGLNPVERASVLHEQRLSSRCEPLPLDRPPLIRVTCLRFAEDDHAVIWDFHHILMDGWCIGIVQEEISALYAAVMAKAALPAQTALPFGRYVSWLEERRNRAEPAFWKRYFHGYEGTPAIPGRRIRGAAAGPRMPRTETCHLDADTTRRLQSLAATQRCTLSDVLQALWGVFLAKHNQGRDVMFGTVRSLRPVDLPGIDAMIGPCIAMVPLRVRYDETSSLQDLLARMADERMNWLDNAAFALPDILTTAGLERDSVSHFLVVENYPLAEAFQGEQQAFASGITVTDVAFWAVNDYEFFVRATPGQGESSVQIDFEYDERCFEPDAIAAVAHRFTGFALRLAQRPHDPLDGMALVSQQQHAHITQAWGAGAVPTMRETEFRAWWAQLLEAHGERTAVRSRRAVLSYHQLHAQAAAMARHLCAAGLRDGDVVALLAHPDEHLVCAMLACLMLGVPFLPIDPQLPAARRSHVLQDSGARWLLTGTTISLDTAPGLQVLAVDAVLASAALTYADFMPACVGSAGTAYLIYTSGTTGLPKGVAVGVRSLLNYVGWMQDEFGVGPGSASALLTSAAYDLGYTALFGSLLTGGCISMLDEQERRDPDAVVRRIVDDKLTFLKATPSYFAMLWSSPAWQQMPSHHLSLVLLGGEPQDFDQLAAFHMAHPQVRIYNHYGPTEATIGCIAGSLTDLVEAGRPQQRLGRPISGARVFICDPALQPVPAGVIGEIFLGGDILAQGYCGAAALDDTRFTRLPWLPGVRVYRTGDFAEWTIDGRVVFHGRRDDQVKVRGYRASLSDITAQVKAQPGVADAVVILEGKGSAQELTCYVSLIPGAGGTARTLRVGLAQQLPTALIPGRFVPVAHIPLTANGKVNRVALSALVIQSDISVAVAPLIPSSGLEATVCEAFCDVLKISQVGPNDDFFDLGGHSIKAILLSSTLRRALGRDVPILAVFEHPTPRQLAHLLADAGPKLVADAALTVLRDAAGGADNIVFLPTVLGSPALFRGISASLASHVRCWGLQCPGFDAEGALPNSIEALGQCFADLLLRTLQPASNTRITLVGWSFGAYLAFETLRKLEARLSNLRLVLIDIPPRTAATISAPNALDAGIEALEADIRQQLGPELSPKDLGRLRALALHHYRLLDAYRLTLPLHYCPVVAVEADDGPMHAGMQAFAAWTHGHFEHLRIAGDHYSVLTFPNREALVRILDATELRRQPQGDLIA